MKDLNSLIQEWEICVQHAKRKPALLQEIYVHVAKNPEIWDELPTMVKKAIGYRLNNKNVEKQRYNAIRSEYEKNR